MTGSEEAMLTEIRKLLDTATAEGLVPAASCEIAVDGRVLPTVAVGEKARFADDGTVIPTEQREPVDAGTLFDLASVTKVFSAYTLLALVEEGVLKLDEPIGQRLPEYAHGAKAQVTLRHLLTHTSGLPSIWRGWHEPLQAALREAVPSQLPFGSTPLSDRGWLLADLLATPLSARPGSGWEYSCTGYNTAMALAERATGRPWADIVGERVIAPLNLHSATFAPEPALTAATEYQPELGRGTVRGVVHDESAWLLGGSCANAGLFASADDVVRLGEAIRVGYTPGGESSMWANQLPGILKREHAEDVANPFGHSLGLRIGQRDWMGSHGGQARGHTGFTGTSLHIDREAGLTIVLLTNCVHPSRGAEGIQGLRVAVAEVVHRYALS